MHGLPNQPAVIWNGIDSQEIYCPVRRDAALACPDQNTTSQIGLPVPVQTKTQGGLPNPVIPGTATSTSNPPPSTVVGSLTIEVHSSSDSWSLVRGPLATTSTTVTPAGSSKLLPSSITTDSSTATLEV